MVKYGRRPAVNCQRERDLQAIDGKHGTGLEVGSKLGGVTRW